MPTSTDEQQQPHPAPAGATDDHPLEAPGTEPEREQDEAEDSAESDESDQPDQPEESEESEESDEAEDSEESQEGDSGDESDSRDEGDSLPDAADDPVVVADEEIPDAEPEPVTAPDSDPAPEAPARFPRVRGNAARIGRGVRDVQMAVGALATLGRDYLAERRGAQVAFGAAAGVVVVALVLTVTLGSGPSAPAAADPATGPQGHPSGSAQATQSTQRMSLTVPGAFTVPGQLALAWPATGQAAIGVPGVGLLGSSGPVDTPKPIASVTKTMTAYLILKDHPLGPGESGPTLIVSAAEAAELPGQEALHQSLVPVRAGERFTERQALQALMLASADNMAEILAAWDSGSESRFVARMNATAASLGMAHTHFSQPSGYLGSSVSTATDLVKLGETAITDPFFADLVDESSAVIPGGAIRNYNALLGQEGIDGIKTGSTNWAGGCLLFSAHTRVGGREVTLVGAVLGQPGNISTMLPSVFAATARLLRSADHALEQVTVVGRGRTVAELSAPSGGSTRGLRLPRALTLVGWPGLHLTLQLSGSAARPVLRALTPEGRTVAAVPLVAD